MKYTMPASSSLPLLAAAALCLSLAACGSDDPDGGGGGGGGGTSPDTIVSLSILFEEPGAGVANTWVFAADGTATLNGDGASPFPYTYEKTGGSTSAVAFEVGGTDRYEMTWTSDTGGTCTESFDGGEAFPCTFAVQ